MIVLLAATSLLAAAAAAPAEYRVQLFPERNRIAVRATLPSDGDALAMADSRPGDVPETAEAGWPGLVRELKVRDGEGHDIALTSAGAEGWKLARAVHGSLALQYEVDLSPLAARGWPALREAAFGDEGHLVVIGRAIFVTTPAQRTSTVRFETPKGWRAVTPWPPASVPSPDDLTENLVAFTREPPDVIEAGGFKLQVVPLGHWRAARDDVRRVLGKAVQRLVAWIGSESRAGYLVVLLPPLEHGGESFRASFALTYEAEATRANSGDWGNTVAHEVFHHWNGWLLKGVDYPSTQWFQEGFTEYAANIAMVSGGLVKPETFYAKVASHVKKYRDLKTPLDAPGTHKGPPLYSGGALVAFTWDGMIREATSGKRGLGDVMHALLRATGNGERAYEWKDIEAALRSVAPGDWAGFHERHIHGTEPLPLASAFARVGLRLVESTDGVRVEPDPSAPASAVALRRALAG